MLQLREINQAYENHHTLWDINLDVRLNCCAAILGQHGTGKTTLFNCILGFLPVMSGEILWHPKNILPCSLLSLASDQRSQLGINYVPQGRPLFSQMTVEENIHIALKAAQSGHSPIKFPTIISELFPELLPNRSLRSSLLSTSLQWQLALARAVSTSPKLLLLDEPSEGLAEEDLQHLVAILSRLTKEYGMGILVMDKDINFIQCVADNFILLHHGRNVMKGTAADLQKVSVSRWNTLGHQPFTAM